GENATITITGPKDYNGTAVVNVDGKNYTVSISNGAGQLEITGFANGTYDVKVTLLETDKYLGSENDTAKVLVNKVESSVTVNVDDIIVGDVAVVNITVPADATGNVTVEIVGVGTYTVPVAGGAGVLVVKDLKVDDYTVKVTYNGDGKYLPNNNETTFKVSKADSDDIKVIDQGNGTVVITVPGNATGNVTVKVGNETYNATVVNGTAVVTLNNVTPGEHEIEVIYSGDENHNGTSTNSTVNIPKYDTPMSIEVSDGKVGDKVKVTVNVPDGLTNNVTVEVNGKIFSVKPVDGKAIVEIEGLLSGNKTVTATYDGDDNYVANSTTEVFKIDKNPAPISATVDNSTAGEVTIEVTLPSDATGYVIVNVNGTDYGINLTAGEKSVTIPVENSGDYTAKVTYLGDEKYLGNSTTVDYHATTNKTSSQVTAEVNDVPIGQDVVVKVTVPEGGDGNVTVRINGTNVTVPVKAGENIINVSGVSEGTHDVIIEYSGNDHVEPQTINKKVTVFRSIIAENITRGWNSPYDYKAEFLDKDGHVLADTEVQFIVNGQTYTAKTNSQGIAYLNVTKLDIGVYTVTCVNPVTGEKRNATTTIVKRLIENKDITMDFVDGTYYVVRAIGDDGKPVGKDEFVDIFVNTIHYSCRTDENGYARLKINLNPRTYEITAEYKSYKVSNKLVVKQTLKLVKKTVKVKKGKKLTLKATLKWTNGKPIKGKKVVFKLQGKKYSAKTNSKGLAKVTIKAKVTKKLHAGKKYKYSATYITNTVRGFVKVTK
ncbi:Ig-like domain-containing protein, partial [Methanobrevibacter thaueri]|uniref:Ig-like domain-containing protein n=1 Tax=Methanobrevibacter thaueri TaxID=190975 RepID=UPI0010576AC9